MCKPLRKQLLLLLYALILRIMMKKSVFFYYYNGGTYSPTANPLNEPDCATQTFGGGSAATTVTAPHLLEGTYQVENRTPEG